MDTNKRERNYPKTLDLLPPTPPHQQLSLNTTNQQQQQQPTLEIQSPKTPTLSRKLKAVSLDSDQTANYNNQQNSLDIARDVFSMPNTPKKQIKHKLSCDFDQSQHQQQFLQQQQHQHHQHYFNHHHLSHNYNNDSYNDIYDSCSTVGTIASSAAIKAGGTLLVGSNLKKFASNTSISGSQTLKTLPEIMTLQDFSDNSRTEPIRVRAKGLLERRGSNASLTIDLGSNSSISQERAPAVTMATAANTAHAPPLMRLNTARSVSNLNLSSFGANNERCACALRFTVGSSSSSNSSGGGGGGGNGSGGGERRKSQEACGNCIIYESVPSKSNGRCASTNAQAPLVASLSNQMIVKKCAGCSNIKCRRKSLSNENLYVPPCGFCQQGALKDCAGTSRNCKGNRKAHYPRQSDLEAMTLSEDFKLHLQNVQYLQTAGNVLSVSDLKQACESRVPKLYTEFWEVPLNLQEKCYVSGSQSRNRYKGVLPNEHSRVHLPGPQTYIHANYIKGPDYTETAYIATQGPMAHTCQDFWEMIWHTNSQIIVMLTGLVEKGRSKCELYFPLGRTDRSAPKSFFYVKTTKERDKFTFDRGGGAGPPPLEEEVFEFEEMDEVEYGPYRIRYLSTDSLDECQIRHLELSKSFSNSNNNNSSNSSNFSNNNNRNNSQHLSKETRTIHHLWYPNWQDHKMANPEQLLKMALHLLNTTNINFNNSNSSNSISDNKIEEDDGATIRKRIKDGGPTDDLPPPPPPPLALLSSSGGGGGRQPIRDRSCGRHCHNDVTIVTAASSSSSNANMTDTKLLDKTSEAVVAVMAPPSPIIVHCSAGIGRTGCFLAILNGIQQLRSNFNVDVLAILCSLRLNRGGMVQTEEQYELIHRVLSLFANNL